jgi:hypothetical protein
MTERKLLWADSEHIDVWETMFEMLEKYADFRITQLESIKDQDLLKGCDNQDALILHCGTLKPMANLQKILTIIKLTYPGIRIGLETNAKHPNTEDLVDFHVDKPVSYDSLKKLLIENIPKTP